VRAGRLEAPLASFEDAHDVMRLIERIDGALERDAKVVADRSTIDSLPRGGCSKPGPAVAAG
jgi:hypothetical protein